MQIGDRVVLISKTNGDQVFFPDDLEIGAEGKVLFANEETITVEFDDYINTHNGAITCDNGKDGHCWHTDPENVEVVTDEQT